LDEGAEVSTLLSCREKAIGEALSIDFEAKDFSEWPCCLTTVVSMAAGPK
jgi:hypothetical protein